MTLNTSSNKSKNIFVILGFARSGTSVITRGLNALGVDLGDHIIERKNNNRWNPTGFFEDEEVIYNINAEVYKKLGSPIRAIPIISHKEFDTHDFSEITSYAGKVLNKRFYNTNNWGFKNPSTAKIIPFWKELFDKENLNDHYIIALRNPLSSAHSFAKLTNMDIEVALILWLTHIIPAIDETVGKKRIVVSYELMMQDPLKELLRIKTLLNIHTQKEDLNTYTNQFLDNKLHHHRFKEEDLKTHAAMTVAPLCLNVYHLLMKAASSELSMDSHEFMATWQSIKMEFDKYYPLYCYMDTILQKNKAFKLSLRSINKSMLWKMLYPLRWVDDKLRSIRQKKRAKKRLLTAYE